MGKDREPRDEQGGVAPSWWPFAGWLMMLKCGTVFPSLPQRTPASARRARLSERACCLGSLTQSRYNSTTLPYTSRSRERIYPVYAVRLLAPAICFGSLMSIPLVFQEDGLREVGQQRLMLKWG